LGDLPFFCSLDVAADTVIPTGQSKFVFVTDGMIVTPATNQSSTL
jgi:hypothetical protein